MSQYDGFTEEQKAKFRQRDKDFMALPFIRNISKEERKKIQADVATRQFYIPGWYEQGRVYWTVDSRKEDHEPEGWRADEKIGKEWAEDMFQYMRKYNGRMWPFLSQIIRDMLMRDRWGRIESSFIEAIFRRIDDDYKTYVKPAMERAKQEYKEVEARVAALEDQANRDREEVATKEDREKRKALFTVVK